METEEVKLVDSYFSMLKDLSRNSKLELIEKLSQSMKTSKSKKDDSWKELYGSLKLDKPADEFITGIKKDRNFTRKIVDL